MEIEQASIKIQRFRIIDGPEVVIKVNYDGSEILVHTASGVEIGGFELDLLEDGAYYITRMGLERAGEQFRHKGIGRQALKLHKKVFEARIRAASDDGIPLPDGSHLTGDAPAFIQKMREEGIVEPCSIEVDQALASSATDG